MVDEPEKLTLNVRNGDCVYDCDMVGLDMRLNRNITRHFTSSNSSPEKPVLLSPGDSVSFVWELTQEVFSIAKNYNAQSRLQRNAVNITRRGC